MGGEASYVVKCQLKDGRWIDVMAYPTQEAATAYASRLHQSMPTGPSSGRTGRYRVVERVVTDTPVFIAGD